MRKLTVMCLFISLCGVTACSGTDNAEAGAEGSFDGAEAVAEEVTNDCARPGEGNPDCD